MAKKKQRRRRRTARQSSSALVGSEKRREFFWKYIRYVEGIADYSQMQPSYKDENTDARVLGWAIGRQIVSLYLVEMLFQCYFQCQGVTSGIATHNLARLFRKLPQELREAVEKTYGQILNSEVEWTWDVCRTVDSFLYFLGTNPITNTRYPWQQDEGTLFAPNKLRPLIYALYIELHGYPYEEGSLDKQYDTEFRSFADSRLS